MKVPLSWLKDYVDIDVNIDELCGKMVAIGLEIEEVIYLGEKVTGVKTGLITEISKHPDADRLRCCKVDVGGEIIPIVTNDQKVKTGDKVPVALHNANLANGLHITKGKMRGQESWGMFCGAEELGITSDLYGGADTDGVLILSADAEVGEDVRKEVGIDDYVIDVCVPSNRQDCNSVYGLAREIAVALGKQCRPLDTDYTLTDDAVKTADLVSVEVSARDLCPSYFLQGLTDVKVERSPLWMTSRLAKAGLRAINNIVDITNYVLIEVGQPMHAFDYDDIADRKIVVRRARGGEKITPLDGKEYTLTTNDLVIADENKAVGIAGIMGGLNSGVKPHTDCVLFESASFARGAVRRTGRRLGLRSDSSARFEKGIESYTNQTGLSRALRLAEELGCGRITCGRIKAGSETAEKTVVFAEDRIEKLLGIKIPRQDVTRILNALNIQTEITEEGIVKCTVPPYREDVNRECDIIEEVIRVYGYDNITGTLMENSRITCGGKTEEDKKIDDIKTLLNGMGYSECVFYPFGGKALFDKTHIGEEHADKNIKLLNPLGEELSLMNTSLAPNMLQCVSLNVNRKNENLKLFECGKAYIAHSLPLDTLPEEEKRVSMAATNINFDGFRDAVLAAVCSMCADVSLARSENKLFHPGISADIFTQNTFCGSFGKIHPEIARAFDINCDCWYAELNFDSLYSLKKSELKYKAIAKFPPIVRDFAFVTDEDTAAQKILDEFLSLRLTEKAELFDVYRGSQLGEDKKSLAISVTFRAADRTLQDAELEKPIAKCLKSISEKYGAVLR